MAPRAVVSSLGVDPQEAYVYALVLGRVVASLRERRGWSQGELAERVGLTQSTLSRMERGQAQPDAFTFTKLAEAFQVTAAELSDYVDRALARSELAAQGAIGPSRPTTKPWWQSALAVAGVAGLGGLVAFAVAAALDEKLKRPKK